MLQSQPTRHSGRAGAGTHSQHKRANSAATENSKRAKTHYHAPTVPSSPPLFLPEDEEEQEQEEQEDEDNEDDEEGELVQVPTWLGSWKAVVNKKIDLPRSQGGMWQSW